MILLPDTAQADVWDKEVAPNIKTGRRARFFARVQHPF